MKNMQIWEKIKQIKGFPLIAAGLAIGLLLIIWGNTGTDTRSDTASETVCEEELDVYISELESRIKNLLEEIPQVQNISVMVTLSGGSEYVYAQDGTGSSKSYVTINDNGERTVFLRENTPQICGIAVVCPGASATLRMELTDLLCALFGLNYAHVYVTG